jgi:hypothetical protein
MLAVADAAATVAKLRDRGISIDDVEEIPTCFMAFTRDPDEVAVIIHQRKT